MSRSVTLPQLTYANLTKCSRPIVLFLFCFLFHLLLTLHFLLLTTSQIPLLSPLHPPHFVFASLFRLLQFLLYMYNIVYLFIISSSSGT